MKSFLTAWELQNAIDTISESISVAEKRKNELERFSSFYFIDQEVDHDYLERLNLIRGYFRKENAVSISEIEQLNLLEYNLSTQLYDELKILREVEILTSEIESLKLRKKQLKRSLALCRGIFDDRKIIRNQKNNIRTFDDEENTDFDLVKESLLTAQNLNFNVYKIYKKCA
ncbi:hypothetical protein Q73A0000_04150 [Kaistella flava (ex Peng et al. 2021)]|uniref:Uncharacterized protein n=1 Tax=Kaistella flava (ex Peng et al. 2021) TaxID=2038776 RepID=A0A7M2Y7G8_9FLAO|nr:hypothetical protein [Kaistella flava (ex Peng et al. 2021)]QOW09614.1 hypothetical protein Q73A0000_04150 [Kaistella flava (ex Peng et al. 2021)]